MLIRVIGQKRFHVALEGSKKGIMPQEILVKVEGDDPNWGFFDSKSVKYVYSPLAWVGRPIHRFNERVANIFPFFFPEVKITSPCPQCNSNELETIEYRFKPRLDATGERWVFFPAARCKRCMNTWVLKF